LSSAIIQGDDITIVIIAVDDDDDDVDVDLEREGDGVADDEEEDDDEEEEEEEEEEDESRSFSFVWYFSEHAVAVNVFESVFLDETNEATVDQFLAPFDLTYVRRLAESSFENFCFFLGGFVVVVVVDGGGGSNDADAVVVVADVVVVGFVVSVIVAIVAIVGTVICVQVHGAERRDDLTQHEQALVDVYSLLFADAFGASAFQALAAS